jgi:hypothetical protein
MYNIIRGTQWAEVSKDGRTSYINGDSRDQYGAEGLLMGVLNVGCGAMFVLLNVRAYNVNVPTKSKSPIQHLTSALGNVCSPIVCLTGALVLWFYLIEVYTM